MRLNRPTAIVAGLALLAPLWIALASPDDVELDTGRDGMRIRAFIQWVSSHVDGAISYAPAALALVEAADATITVESPVRLPRDRVIGFARALLIAHDLTLVDAGSGIWLAERLTKPTLAAARFSFVESDALEAHRDSPLPISTVVRLAHVDPPAVLEAVAAALPPGTAAAETVIPMPKLDTVVVRAPGRDAWAIARLLRGLDAPTTDGRAATERRLAALERKVQALERRR